MYIKIFTNTIRDRKEFASLIAMSIIQIIGGAGVVVFVVFRNMLEKSDV